METEVNNGVAHFMEHMLVQGIPSLPNVEDFSSFIESLAGTYGAQTESLQITFHITLPQTYLETAVKIASEVTFEPLFVEAAIEKERVAVINELTQRMDSHWYKISKFYREVRYTKDHPLARDVGGELGVVKKLTRDDLILYWKEYFKTDNTYLLVVGNFKEEVLKDHLNKYFEKYQKSHFRGFPKLSNKDYSRRQVAIREDKKLQTCYIDFSFPALNLYSDNKDLLRQSILLTILGRLRNSRLFKLLRYQKGLVYNVSAGSSSTVGMGSIAVSSETSKENLDEVIELITKELAVFIKNGLTQEELEFAKNFLTNQWLMAFDHPSTIGDWIGYDLLWKDKIKLPEEYAGDIADFTNEELLSLMKKHWDFSKLNLIIQGPVEESKASIDKYSKMISELK